MCVSEGLQNRKLLFVCGPKAPKTLIKFSLLTWDNRKPAVSDLCLLDLTAAFNAADYELVLRRNDLGVDSD